MDSDKAVGYVLLLIGLGIIFFSIFSALSVFNGSKAPPQLLNIEKSSDPITVGGMQIPGLEFIPTAYLNQSANLTFFMLFMFFLLSAGGRIASIGITMLSIKKPNPPTQN
jgi:hypothetical protein